MSFWYNVKAEIKLQRKTQEGLAEDASIKYKTLAGWIARNRLPRVDEAISIAEALGRSVEYLYYGRERHKSDARIDLEMYLDGLTDDDLERAKNILEAALPKKSDHRKPIPRGTPGKDRPGGGRRAQ